MGRAPQVGILNPTRDRPSSYKIGDAINDAMATYDATTRQRTSTSLFTAFFHGPPHFLRERPNPNAGLGRDALSRGCREGKTGTKQQLHLRLDGGYYRG